MKGSMDRVHRGNPWTGSMKGSMDRVHRGNPWTGSMKGSMDRVHRGGPWTWGPCFVYVPVECFRKKGNTFRGIPFFSL